MIITTPNDKLSGSEALYGFMGWLTTRRMAETFSAAHNAARAADLVDKFCKMNGLEDPHEGWSDNLMHPNS